jgi:alkylation response protein AidB-like acyl-CoA dehydrogenase
MLARARDFAASEVAPRAAGWAEARASTGSHELLPAAADAGLLAIQVPVEHGGLGQSFACKCAVAEALAAADFGFALSLINSHNVADLLARSASRRVREAHLPALLAGRRAACTAFTEPGTGSDLFAMRTIGTRTPSGWRLDGRKDWIINAIHASTLLVYAQTRPGAGAEGIAGFVVDADGQGFAREAATHGAMRSAGTGGFTLSGYACRDEELLQPPSLAWRAALESINGARIYVAAMCCGMVAEALRIASDYGLHRHAFEVRLHDHQGWRWHLADAAVALEAARLLVGDAAACVDAGRETSVAAARAKLFATRTAQRHLAALLHAMGAEGLRDKHPLMRHLAAAQAATLVDGSDAMLLERIAKDILNRTRVD